MATPKWQAELIEQYNKGWITPDEYFAAVEQHKVQAILGEIEQKTHDAYEQAAFEMQQKVDRRLANYEAKRAEMRKLVDAGELDETTFRNWRWRQLAANQELRGMAETLAEDMVNYNKIAARIAQDGMADVYALSANYAAYEIDLQDWKFASGKFGQSFTLYNHDTAEILLKQEQKSLLPAPSAKKLKELKELKKTNPDLLWNTQKMQSAMLQGVLQGESASAIAERLKGVAKMDENQAIRNARTMTTNVQNMGHQRAYQNAKDMGIDLVIEWYAMLDGNTRDSHRRLHGEKKKNNKTAKFSNGCRWPGDPEGPAAEVYNCRCTTVSWVKGFESELQTKSNWLDQNNMSFEEWQKGKKKAAQAASAVPATPKASKAAKKAAAPAADQMEEVRKRARDYSYADHERDNFSWDFWWDGLTDAERNGIEEYTGSSFERMNALLRGSEKWSDVRENMRSYWQANINDCTDALSHRGLAHDTKLYRGMGSNSTLARALGIDQKQIATVVQNGSIKGMRFIEKGFCSTGVDPGHGWDKDVVLDIVAPKGTKGFYVDPVSSCHGEKECLLQRGMIFEIYDTEYLQDGTLKLFVQIVGNSPLKKIKAPR